jgi:hypothetical protein
MLDGAVFFQQRTIRINRAPVLTLWAAVVAERLGFDHNTALTLGRAVAGLNAIPRASRMLAQRYMSSRNPTSPSISRTASQQRTRHGTASGLAETGGRIQAQSAGERPEFGSQTGPRLIDRRELRGFLSTWKPRRFAGTAWWSGGDSNL